MSSFSSKAQQITITGTDLSDEGVIVEFSDGTAVLFRSQFLYDVRDQDANVSVAGPQDE